MLNNARLQHARKFLQQNEYIVPAATLLMDESCHGFIIWLRLLSTWKPYHKHTPPILEIRSYDRWTATVTTNSTLVCSLVGLEAMKAKSCRGLLLIPCAGTVHYWRTSRITCDFRIFSDSIRWYTWKSPIPQLPSSPCPLADWRGRTIHWAPAQTQ